MRQLEWANTACMHVVLHASLNAGSSPGVYALTFHWSWFSRKICTTG
jgi:hypothetical protein